MHRSQTFICFYIDFDGLDDFAGAISFFKRTPSVKAPVGHDFVQSPQRIHSPLFGV